MVNNKLTFMKKLILLLLAAILSCTKHSDSPYANTVYISSWVQHTSLAVKNNTNSTVDLSNWKLEEVIDGYGYITNTYIIHNKTLAKGESVTYTTADLGFQLNYAYTKIYLYDNLGNLKYPKY